jgi:hypothetical protein
MIVGGIFGAAAATALLPAITAFPSYGPNFVLVAWFLPVLLGALICLLASTVRGAFGYGFLLLGAAVFLLPVSTFFMSGILAADVLNEVEGAGAAEVVGVGFFAIIATGVATFVGLIVGAVLLAVGAVLSLGARREVIIVQSNGRRDPEM